MCGLPQSVLIVHDFLVQHLASYLYDTSNKTPVLWTHDSHTINFTLVVDDFEVNVQETSISYTSNQNWNTSTKSPHTGKEKCTLGYHFSDTMKEAQSICSF